MVNFVMEFQRSSGDIPEVQIITLAKIEILSTIGRGEFGSYTVVTTSILFDGKVLPLFINQ